MNKQVLFNRFIRKYIHKFIVWYLFKCGTAFHYGAYGEYGLYVTLMSDRMYHEYQKININ